MRAAAGVGSGRPYNKEHNEEPLLLRLAPWFKEQPFLVMKTRCKLIWFTGAVGELPPFAPVAGKPAPA